MITKSFTVADRLRPTRTCVRRAFVRAGSVGAVLTSLMAIVFANDGVTVEFHDVTAAAKIDFRHHSPLSELRHIHLFMGSGLAWLDFDRDGWPDLFFCQGLAFPPEPSDRRPSDQFFRNGQDGTFENVTLAAGLVDAEYTMGAAAADYDNDGFVDLYVTNFHGENRLYRNNGDGTFTATSRAAGVNLVRYGSSCAWGDIDGDGNLDLFVVNYVKIDLANYKTCEVKAGDKVLTSTCHPKDYAGEYDVLYRNRGDGTFEDHTTIGGLTKETPRKGLGVVAADLDGDGDLDFYVANDTVPNQLWENQGRGTFVDRGTISGTAVNRRGLATASMGLAVGDVNGDGLFDLFHTNYFREKNTFLRNEGRQSDGQLLFLDVTEEMGLGGPSTLRLGFGASLFDPDNDGWPDYFVANGHVNDRTRELARSDEPFAQLPLFFRNENGRRFRDDSKNGGGYFLKPWIGRGSAVADYDRDGLADLAVQHLNDRPALLRNVTAGAGHSLPLELIGTRSNRFGVGATIRIRAGGRELVHVRQAGTSYLSCDEERMLIGLGAAQRAERVTVQWPGGKTESWRDLPAGRLARFVEGTGEEG
jgi:hypothetical protein